MSAHALRTGQSVLDAARARLEESRTLGGEDRSGAEDLAREALSLFASAMNWLEDTEHFESTHQEMHAAGRWVKKTFGCELHQDGDHYEQRCPVDLAHKRIGFSIEYIAKSVKCSVCGLEALDCVHIVGREYDGQVCSRVIEAIDEILGIALVSRPAQPDARIIAAPVPVEGLQAVLPASWRPGMPVSCDKCLRACGGVEAVDLSDLGRYHGAPVEPGRRRSGQTPTGG